MNSLFDQEDINSDENAAEKQVEDFAADVAKTTQPEEPGLFSYTTESRHSTAETARMGGLAWSTGIVLFGAVILMMLIGWGADLLFGTKPWGMIGGLIVGAVIGFVQLFRTSSEIFRK
jgi:F0F1-type ATP synthase assembly protein I